MKTSDFKYSDAEIRKDFPLISQTELAYLDNAATSQKPYSVLEAVRSYYEKENANPMRGLYDLSVAATEAYERARKAAADFIKAPKAENIVFTRNASESLNLIAYTYGMEFINEGDEILVSITEHHSNFLPWQNVAKKKGALIKFLECDEEGYISVEALKAALSPKIKLVAITQVSNAH